MKAAFAAILQIVVAGLVAGLRDWLRERRNDKAIARGAVVERDLEIMRDATEAERRAGAAMAAPRDPDSVAERMRDGTF